MAAGSGSPNKTRILATGLEGFYCATTGWGAVYFTPFRGDFVAVLTF